MPASASASIPINSIVFLTLLHLQWLQTSQFHQHNINRSCRHHRRRPRRSQPSQYLGLVNVTNNGNTSNHLFFVEFDSVQDFEFSDIEDNHVGVNINRMTSVKSTGAGFFVDGDSRKQDLCLQSGEKIQAWIDYDAAKPELNITLSLFSKKQSTPIISFPVDLSPVFQDLCMLGFLHQQKLKNMDVVEDWELEVGPHKYSYKELKEATNGFHEKELLGFGGSGKVYKGILPDSNTQIAVKRISQESKQGLTEFISEISTISVTGIWWGYCVRVMRQVVRYLEREVSLPEILAPPCEGAWWRLMIIQKVKSW
ncbi:hypothetical protein L6452_14374 [Arctium lappa]|uniref:Uncharacterized protein n=1 Tax=Arctium lappa TaxID=4217 RepID=A0ACB9CKR0_ARCLA|nr:hypothetical protein L6452_14374 [Arctium lappa]